MQQNFTPLNIEKLKKGSKGGKLNTILLAMAVGTAGIFALLLFIFIQKKTDQSPLDTSIKANTESITKAPPEPSFTPVPTVEIFPTIPVSTESATSATPSSQLEQEKESTSEAQPFVNAPEEGKETVNEESPIPQP